MTYREFVGRGRRRREEDVEGHGATQCGTVVFVSLVVSTKHLCAADFGWLAVGLHFCAHTKTLLSLPAPAVQRAIYICNCP